MPTVAAIQSFAEQGSRDCLAKRARLVARIVTGVYDDQLRGCGLTAAQLGIMLVIVKMGDGAYAAGIGRALHIEPSTLSRNLGVLERDGLIAVHAGEGRARLLEVTGAGRRVLGRARDGWEAAQAELANRLGPEGIAALRLASDRLAKA